MSGWGDLLNTFGLSFDCGDWLFLPGLGYGAVPDIVMEALWNACRADGQLTATIRTTHIPQRFHDNIGNRAIAQTWKE